MIAMIANYPTECFLAETKFSPSHNANVSF